MRLFAFILSTIACFAQTGTSYTFLNPPPPQVTSLTGTVVGEPGQETFYYWVVARYPGGNSAPYGPVTVRNARPVAQMSTLRYITLTWTAQDLATGYDVLRSTSSTTPTGACGCVIYENTSSTTVNDTGITASAYTVTNGSSVYGAIYIDSLNEAPPKLKQNVNGTISDVGAGSGTGFTYVPTRTSDTVLTLPAIDANTFAVGGSYACAAVSEGETVTVSSGTGTLWIAVGSDCAVKVRHNVTASCSAGCTAVSSSSGFDATDIPLYEWTVTSGVLDATGTSRLATYSGTAITAGTGVSLATSSGVTTISASSTYPPMPAATELYAYDDFWPAASDCGANTYIGKLGWRSTSAGSGGDSPVCTTTTAGRPGILMQRTGGTSNNDAQLHLSTFRIDPSETFTVRYVFKLTTSTNVTARVGLITSVSSSTTNFLTIEKENADTNWFASSADNSAERGSRQDLGVAASTDWVAVQIRRVDASTIGYKIASTLSALTSATEYTLTGSMPTTGLTPFVWIQTHTAALRSIEVDFFDARITGLTR